MTVQKKTEDYTKAEWKLLVLHREMKRIRQEEQGLLYEAQPYQEPFHKCTDRRILLHGGNRSGKTVSCAMEVYWHCIGQHPYKKVPEPPVYWRACGLGMEEHVSKVIVENFRRIIPRNVLKGDRFNYNRRDHMLRFKNGSWIEFMSFDQDPGRGAGRDLDGAWLDDLGCARSFLEQTQARVVDRNGQIIRSICPEEGIGWEYKWYERAQNHVPNYSRFQFSTKENKYLSKAGLDQLIQDIGDDTRQLHIRLYGDFLDLGGSIYPMLDRKFHVKHAAEVGCDDTWTRYIAIDPGINKPHCALFGAVGPGGYIHFYREVIWAGPVHPDYCNRIKTAAGLETIAGFRLDGHWDWDNRTAKGTGENEPLNIEREFRQSFPDIMKAPLDIRNWQGIDQVRARLRLDVISKKPLITFEPELEQTWYEMTHYAMINPGKKDPTRHNPRIRKVDDDLPDCVRIFVTSNLPYTGTISAFVMESQVMTDEYGMGF